MQHTRFHIAGILLLLVSLLLAACTSSTAQEPAPQPPTATVLLPTATEPAAPDPTTPPAPTHPPALVGPELTVAYEGDMNRDGVRDVVAYKAADITPAPDMRSYLAEMPLTIAEAMVVQEPAQGSAYVLVQASVSPQGVAATDSVLIPADQFGEPGPVAFLMGVDPQAQDAQVSFIPLDATGNAYGQGFGLYWNGLLLTFVAASHASMRLRCTTMPHVLYCPL